VAKKVRTRPEEAEENKFEFPVFDERAFVDHELELTYGMVFAVVFAAFAGLLSGVVSLVGGGGVPVALAVLVGLAVIVASPFVIPRLRTEASGYTKGDWAGLIALQFFGWLGLWFLIAELFPPR
jgi:hypothetical protein